MAADPLLGRLREGVAALDLALPGPLLEAMLAYLRLLERWNRAYNLSAIRDPEEMLQRHLLDSLSILPYVEGDTLLDVGSGAGLPGIPLALARPGLTVTLLDSNGKKQRFTRQVALELGLSRLRFAQARLDRYQPGYTFDTVVSRAFAALGDYVPDALRLCRPGGRVLAMKGRLPEDELVALPHGLRQCDRIALHVPGVDAQRHLLAWTAPAVSATEEANP
ncbi:16S rRNA m(7)G-527 methyltransferase [Alkalispirillum mobile]|uniref:Ribosomal RNA small subunit methyltransferase G n=1 Tax=Alkalispirillum mobile TaxID=85925 RepID=A0A498BU83_9GAMM|nr:16S rRNA (guanine(527)-N(7))-methyltransferase RsmG [Alkalispirillum mobile]RLK46507.1 16S rRNA m(7)G-527 methyltransferase [Alkalispirillum mobile]